MDKEFLETGDEPWRNSLNFVSDSSSDGLCRIAISSARRVFYRSALTSRLLAVILASSRLARSVIAAAPDHQWSEPTVYDLHRLSAGIDVSLARVDGPLVWSEG